MLCIFISSSCSIGAPLHSQYDPNQFLPPTHSRCREKRGQRTGGSPFEVRTYNTSAHHAYPGTVHGRLPTNVTSIPSVTPQRTLTTGKVVVPVKRRRGGTSPSTPPPATRHPQALRLRCSPTAQPAGCHCLTTTPQVRSSPPATDNGRTDRSGGGGREAGR